MPGERSELGNSASGGTMEAKEADPQFDPPLSELDSSNHDIVGKGSVTIVQPSRHNPDIDGFILHLLQRLNEYHLSFRPTEWRWTDNAPLEAYLLFTSLMLDSAVSGLVLLAMNDVLLPTIIIQRSIAEYFIRASYYDKRPRELQQAFDHNAAIQYRNAKRDPHSSKDVRDKAEAFYIETKSKNPDLEKRGASLKKMMRLVAKDKNGWLYTFFYGFPSDIVHGTIGGLHQVLQAQPNQLEANIRRSPEDVNGDLLSSARYMLHFGDIMTRRFRTRSHVNRQWLEGRLEALEAKHDIS